MKKLCIFTLYSETGASSQYRAYIYKEELDKHFETQWFYFWGNAYVTKYMHNKRKYIIPIAFYYFYAVIRRCWQLLFIAPKSDIIFLQKSCIPKIKKTFLNGCKKNHVRIIFDVDDAIYLNPGDNSDKIAQIADIVICGNETLQQHYLSVNKHSVILPTVENTLKYQPFWCDTFDEKCIGWIGSKATIRNLEIIVEPINHIVERHPEVHFYIISNDALDFTTKIKNCTFLPWNKDNYISNISKFTIGIMPLENTKFNHGKCGFKLIQYLNMKKPVIASSIGANIDIVQNHGILADTAEEWEIAFERLLYDRKTYQTYIAQIEKDFFRTYHFEKITNKLIEILNT